MAILYELAVGDYAPLSSGIFGLVGSVVLAIPALSTADSRKTLIRLQHLQISLRNPDALKDQAESLLGRALREVDRERRMLLIGLALLAVSFAQLVAHAIAAPAA